ncbi:hypothetical protein LK07_26630 [Streptomyces pluripotens]|uniref:Uncharacterized protein n=1 Tax=Streptomyces pluripotens TaxID=1355015 RepID=A0A221P3Z8_9ACTN|nr:hypothetical protein LK06_025470 [Streptomyces pluripotens]ASN27003.1 hypothetical protein LK07_26630 [Streptomyces pluripotens]
MRRPPWRKCFTEASSRAGSAQAGEFHQDPWNEAQGKHFDLVLREHDKSARGESLECLAGAGVVFAQHP